MITANMLDYPEHRINFYLLLTSIITHTFQAFFQIPPASQVSNVVAILYPCNKINTNPHRVFLSFSLQTIRCFGVQKHVIDAIVWGFKHRERNIAQTGLDLLFTFLEHVNNMPQFNQAYYTQFFLSNLNDVFYVLTDRLHKSQFNTQCKILRHLFGLVETGKVTAPLWNPQQHAGVSNNQQFLRVYLANMLSSHFSNLSKQQVHACVNGFFAVHSDEAAYRTHLRDFLIQLKEFGSGDDNKDLYADDNDANKKQREEAIRQQRAAVPGVLNPNEIDDDDDDL
jgi:exportin-1